MHQETKSYELNKTKEGYLVCHSLRWNCVLKHSAFGKTLCTYKSVVSDVNERLYRPEPV
jgi:hypothetical protein